MCDTLGFTEPDNRFYVHTDGKQLFRDWVKLFFPGDGSELQIQTFQKFVSCLDPVLLLYLSIYLSLSVSPYVSTLLTPAGA